MKECTDCGRDYSIVADADKRYERAVECREQGFS